MNRKILKTLLACVMAFIFGTTYFVTAAAATNDSVTLADLKQITVLDDDDLFSNMKELLPGDQVSNDVTITNNSDQEVTFYMYAEVKDSHKNIAMSDKTYSATLLSMLQLQLTMGGNVFYNGPLSGNPTDARSGQLVNGSLVLDKSKSLYGITLCKLPAKSSATLKIDLSVPGIEMDNDFQKTFTAVDWVFICNGTDINNIDVKPDDSTKTTTSPAPTKKTATNTNSTNDNTPNNTTYTATTSTNSGTLPKTGSVVSYLAEALGILGVLVIGLCIIDAKRKKKMN